MVEVPGVVLVVVVVLVVPVVTVDIAPTLTDVASSVEMLCTVGGGLLAVSVGAAVPELPPPPQATSVSVEAVTTASASCLAHRGENRIRKKDWSASCIDCS